MVETLTSSSLLAPAPSNAALAAVGDNTEHLVIVFPTNLTNAEIENVLKALPDEPKTSLVVGSTLINPTAMQVPDLLKRVPSDEKLKTLPETDLF